MNLNANLPLDNHEFARSRFANSCNDEFFVILMNFVILTYFCHTDKVLVILSLC